LTDKYTKMKVTLTNGDVYEVEPVDSRASDNFWMTVESKNKTHFFKVDMIQHVVLFKSED